MSRTLRFLLLSLVLVLAGCGDDDASTDTPGGASTSAAAETPANDAGREATSDGDGVTAQQFGAIQLRSQRAKVRKRLGAPAATSKPDGSTQCLDYPAVDDAGKPVQGLVYRFCFDRTGQLTVRTTISTAP
jgi:hypothetical protein